MTQVASGLALLMSPVRRGIVEILSNLPVAPTKTEPHTRADGLTASELGQRVGLHLSTVRFHVDQLVESGLVTAHDVRLGVGRPRRHYAINPGHLAGSASARTYELLASLLVDSFGVAQTTGAPQTAEDAAAGWVASNRAAIVPEGLPLGPARTPGHFLAKVGVLLDVLRSWGYTADVTTTDDGHTAELTLGQCPIRELAEHNPAVACGIHRGLIRATMETLGESDAEVGLSPFVETDLCIARVTSSHPFTSQEVPQ